MKAANVLVFAIWPTEKLAGLASRFALWVLIALLCIIGPFGTVLQAQNYLTSSGTPGFAAPYPVEMGFVDAASGNLHLEIPLGSYPQRGTSAPLVPKLTYDSHIWTVPTDGVSAVWTIIGAGAPLDTLTYGTWGLIQGGSTYLQEIDSQYTITGTGNLCNVDFVLWDASGTQRYFNLNLTYNSQTLQCEAGSAYAADSSGYLLSMPTGLVPPTVLITGGDDFPPFPVGAAVYAPDGTLVYTGAQEQYPAYTLAEDSNGNYLYWNDSAVIDTVGRQIIGGGSNAYCVNGSYGVLGMSNSQGSSSSDTYCVYPATIPLQTDFQQSGISECSSNCTAEVIQSIVLPDGSSYTFTYDCFETGNTACNSPAGQSGYYGTLTSMTLPTGQLVTYGYGNFADALGNVSRWLTSKINGSGSWSYSPSVTSGGGWNVTHPCASGVQAAGCQQVVVVRPDLSEDILTLAIDNGAWPTTIQSNDTNESTVLSTTVKTWDFSNPCILNICEGKGAQDVRNVLTYTTLPVSGGGSITKKTAYTYDSPQTANITKVQEWRYQSGTSSTAAFSLVADRTTSLIYQTFATNNNNINRPKTLTVTNNAGTTVAQTTITYDGYGQSPCTTGLQDVSATNHDDVNFGPNYTARGNPTQIKRWVTGSTFLTTYLCYDTTGQVIQAYDPNLNRTTYSYTDANAYLATVTDAVGSTSFQYYSGSGKVSMATDYNLQNTSYSYAATFDRLTEIEYPIGWSLNTYTSPTQFDSYAAVGDTTASVTCVSCSHSQALLDSLGRVKSQSLVNNPPGQSYETATFDSLNRAATVSHPNFGAADPNDVVETPHYDGLSRSLGVTHPDAESTQIAYGAAVTALGGLSAQQSSAYGVGFPVLSVDEAGNLRQEWLDGFGRVIEVDEPSGAGGLTSPFYTNYTYDALGNLTSVVQGIQTRTYQYDGLGRLMMEMTPEASTTTNGVTVQNPVTLSYVTTGGALCSGNPSNPCTKTDARGIVTTYAYDTANRLTGKTHVPTTTGPETYTYGTSAASYNIGRLLTMTDPSGSETYSYDQIGRVTQVTKIVGATSYITKYAYNPGSELTKVTYPSGRVVEYSYDDIGHLCEVAVTVAANCGASTGKYLSISNLNYDATNRPLIATYGNGVIARATYSPQRSQLAFLSYGAGTLTTAVTSIAIQVGQAIVAVTSNAGIYVGDTVTISGTSNSSCNGSFIVDGVGVDDGSLVVDLTEGTGCTSSSTGGTLTDDTSSATTFLRLNYYYQEYHHPGETSCSGNGVAADNNGQIQCIFDSSAGTGDSGRNVKYAYDFLGRISTASTTGSTAYPAWGISETYDRYGNRSAQTATAGTAPQPSFSISATTNQITTGGYQYDAAGHLTAEPWPFSGTYIYDGEDCLTNFAGNGNSATYTCDGNHLRVKKVTNTVTTVSIYSGGRVIAEYDNGAAVTSPTREYIYGHNLLAVVTGSTSGSGGTIIYQHRDHVSPRLYTNSSGSCVGDQATYPFGELWYQNTDTECSTNATSSWLFTTYERDQESGIDYALARSYYSSEGRFMSPDPVEGNPSNPQSWNRYAYSLNDPINNFDPSGQSVLGDIGILLDLLAGFFDGELSDLFAVGGAALTGDAASQNCDLGTCSYNPINAALIYNTPQLSGGFQWGGMNDPGGEVGYYGQIFSPAWSPYWGATEAYIGRGAVNMYLGGVTGGVLGQVEAELATGFMEGYTGVESPLVPSTYGFAPGPVLRGTNVSGQLTSRGTFWKSTVENSWDRAEVGPNGGRLCPSCGDEVIVTPNSGTPRDWDVSHNPSWTNRTFAPGTTRPDVIRNYQEGTSLECPACNRGGGNNDARFNP
jgi:RHS repeat-associated protein